MGQYRKWVGPELAGQGALRRGEGKAPPGRAWELVCVLWVGGKCCRGRKG